MRSKLKRNLYLLILVNLSSLLVKQGCLFLFFQILLYLVNKTWHITNGLMFTYIEKENGFIFIFLLPMYIYVHSYVCITGLEQEHMS